MDTLTDDQLKEYVAKLDQIAQHTQEKRMTKEFKDFDLNPLLTRH